MSRAARGCSAFWLRKKKMKRERERQGRRSERAQNRAVLEMQLGKIVVLVMQALRGGGVLCLCRGGGG